jgi:hypothetical protein
MGSGSDVGGLLMGPCTTVLGAEKSPLEKIELERTRLPVPPSTEIATPSRPLKAMVLAEAAAVPPNGGVIGSLQPQPTTNRRQR